EIGEMGAQVLALDRELFEHHAGARVPLSLFLLLLIVLFAAVALAEACRHTWFKPALAAEEVVEPAEPETELSPIPCQIPDPGLLFPLPLGLLLLAFYLFTANSLGTRGGLSHGGYLKPRLALLPPLIWLACLRESVNIRIRLAFRVLTVTLL